MKEITTSAAVVPVAIVEEAWREVGASVERFCLTAGIATLATMMEEDAARLCGPRYGRAEDKAGHRRGKTKGKVGFHGGKVEVERPRVRVRDGCEIALPSWETAQSGDLLGRWALNLMLINVSTRHFGRAVRPPEGDISAAKGAAVVQALLDNPVGRGFDPTVCRLFVVARGQGAVQGDPQDLRPPHSDPALPGSQGSQHHRAHCQALACRRAQGAASGVGTR